MTSFPTRCSSGHWPCYSRPHSYHSGNLEPGQECPGLSAECDSGEPAVLGSWPLHASRAGRPEISASRNPLTLLVPGPPSRRKVLPDFIRIPEEVMAVTPRRKNTDSSCRNTQNAITTASLPDTGTRNYRCPRIDSWVPRCRPLRAAFPPAVGGWFFAVLMHCGDVGALPGEPRGLSLGSLWLLAQN